MAKHVFDKDFRRITMPDGVELRSLDCSICGTKLVNRIEKGGVEGQYWYMPPGPMPEGPTSAYEKPKPIAVQEEPPCEGERK